MRVNPFLLTAPNSFTTSPAAPGYPRGRPATFVYAGINVARSGLFTGVRGKQIAGRCVLIDTAPFPCQQGSEGITRVLLEGIQVDHATGGLRRR